MFIAIEAVEGAGKTTQARLLHDRLARDAIPTLLTREPGGAALAEELRRVLVCGAPDSMDAATETLIFCAARRDHLRRTILPALARGYTVICDRFVGSTLALQTAADPGVAPALIAQLHEQFCFAATPDITILLDADADTALARSKSRLGATDATGPATEDRFEAKGGAFHRRVRDRFLELASADPTWHRIDTEGLDIDSVHAQIASLVLHHPSPPSAGAPPGHT